MLRCFISKWEDKGRFWEVPCPIIKIIILRKSFLSHLTYLRDTHESCDGLGGRRLESPLQELLENFLVLCKVFPFVYLDYRCSKGKRFKARKVVGTQSGRYSGIALPSASTSSDSLLSSYMKLIVHLKVSVSNTIVGVQAKSKVVCNQ